MSNPALTPLDHDLPDYPREIVKGDIIAVAFKALQTRLKQLFPEDVFSHHILPPSPSEKYFKSLPTGNSNILLGFGGLRSHQSKQRFAGDLDFTIGALLQLNNANDLYIGTGQLRGIGAAGIIAAAGALNGWYCENVGNFFVKSATIAPTQDWFDGRAILVVIDGYFEDVELSDALFKALPRFDPAPAEIKGKEDE